MVAKTRSGKKRSAGGASRPAKKNAGMVLTYANLSTALTDPRLLKRYDQAYAQVRAQIGRNYPMLIGGRDQTADALLEKRSPVNTDVVLGYCQKGTAQDAKDAIAAAKDAFPAWSALRWQRRVAMMRKVAAVINRRLFELSAWLSLDVGKSRAEALGDVKETADLIDYYCDQVEANEGFDHPMKPEGTSRTRSIMKPYDRTQRWSDGRRTRRRQHGDPQTGERHADQHLASGTVLP